MNLDNRSDNLLDIVTPFYPHSFLGAVNALVAQLHNVQGEEQAFHLATMCFKHLDVLRLQRAMYSNIPEEKRLAWNEFLENSIVIWSREEGI